MEKHLHLDCVFERATDFEERVAVTRFKAIEWRILFALEGFATAREVARTLHLGPQFMDDTLGRFLEQGLIIEREWGLGEYLDRAKTMHLGENSQVRLNGHADSRTHGAGSSAVADRRTSECLAKNGEGRSNGATLPSNRSPARDATVSFAVKKRFRLKMVLDFIQGHAGGGTLGQLAVYRTFMAIPSDVLRESGLQKLDFNDESIEIDSPRVRKAIVDAVSKTLRVDLPAGYFLE